MFSGDAIPLMLPSNYRRRCRNANRAAAWRTKHERTPADDRLVLPLNPVDECTRLRAAMLEMESRLNVEQEFQKELQQVKFQLQQQASMIETMMAMHMQERAPLYDPYPTSHSSTLNPLVPEFTPSKTVQLQMELQAEIEKDGENGQSSVEQVKVEGGAATSGALEVSDAGEDSSSSDECMGRGGGGDVSGATRWGEDPLVPFEVSMARILLRAAAIEIPDDEF